MAAVFNASDKEVGKVSRDGEVRNTEDKLIGRVDGIDSSSHIGTLTNAEGSTVGKAVGINSVSLNADIRDTEGNVVGEITGLGSQALSCDVSDGENNVGHVETTHASAVGAALLLLKLPGIRITRDEGVGEPIGRDSWQDFRGQTGSTTQPGNLGLKLICGSFVAILLVGVAIFIGVHLSAAAKKVSNGPAATPPAVALLRTIQSSGMNIDNVSWSPGGGMFVDAGYNVEGNMANFVSEIRRASDGALVSSHQTPDYWLNTVSWSPNGEYIAGGYDSDVQIWNAATGSQINEIAYWASTGISWSPDSRYVVTSGQEQPTVWSVVSGSQISTYVPTDGLIDGAVWSPTGNMIVSGTTIWNGMTGRVVRKYVGGDQNGFPVSSWSPSGREIVSIDGDGTIVAWDATTGATIWQSQQGLGANSLSWSPNGKYIAWLAGGQAGIIDAATGDPVATFGSNVLSAAGNNADGSNAPSIAWSPDGHYITTASGSGPVQIWQAPNWSY